VKSSHFLFLSSSNRRLRSSKSTFSPPALFSPGTLFDGRLLLGTDGRSGKDGAGGGADGAALKGPTASIKAKGLKNTQSCLNSYSLLKTINTQTSSCMYNYFEGCCHGNRTFQDLEPMDQTRV
jgi:hypothetical protein